MIRLLAVWLLLGAGCGDDEGTERELFLKRFRDYSRAPADDKGPALEALRRLRPKTSAVRDAHGACLLAYGGIERAEMEHARAERLIGEIDAGVRPPTATAEIEQAVRASDDAIQQARAGIDRCIRLVDGLRLGRE